MSLDSDHLLLRKLKAKKQRFASFIKPCSCLDTLFSSLLRLLGTNFATFHLCHLGHNLLEELCSALGTAEKDGKGWKGAEELSSDRVEAQGLWRLSGPYWLERGSSCTY